MMLRGVPAGATKPDPGRHVGRGRRLEATDSGWTSGKAGQWPAVELGECAELAALDQRQAVAMPSTM